MVDVPQLATLAPGSFPIEQLEVPAIDLATHGVTLHTQSVGNPLAPDAAIEVSFAGPPLAPTEVRQMRLVALWRDTEGTASVDSEPQVLTMRDPRPPAQITVPDELQYLGRPDVMGLSMVENRGRRPLARRASRLLHGREPARGIAGRSGGGLRRRGTARQPRCDDRSAARATLFRSRPELFPSHLFERLQNVVWTRAAQEGLSPRRLRQPARAQHLPRVGGERVVSPRRSVRRCRC